MAGAFVTSSELSVAPGNNYEPSSGTDTCLVWVAYARRPGPTTISANDGSWLFGATPMTEAPNTDFFNDIAGGGDPASAGGYLANPGTSAAALDVTWSNTTTAEFGFALTLSGIDQSTPLHSSTGNTYTGTASPSLTYTAPAGAVVIYWRAHAQSTDTVWTDPTGFTNLEDFNFVTSPSYRTFGLWYKEVATLETSVTVSATSDAAGDGGVHGLMVFQEAAAGSATGKSNPLIGPLSGPLSGAIT